MGIVMRRLFTRAVILYGVIVTLSALLRVFISDLAPIMALYMTGAHVFLVGAVILLPIALWLCKPRRAAWVLLPPIGIFLLIYGGQFIPGRSIDSADGESIRVMTYNILWRDSDYQATIEVIRAADVDVVALQEVSPEAEFFLREALATEYPYMEMATQSALTTGGSGLLSRFPIVESTTFRGLFNNQRVVLDVDGTPMVIYNIHATIPRGWTIPWKFDIQQRTSDINTLIAAVKAETERVIVMGDFNMTDLSESYQDLTGILVDSYRQVGWGMGWTHAGPLVANKYLFNFRILRLDYIFLTQDGLRPLNSSVWGDSGGSDHLPVVSTIEIRR